MTTELLPTVTPTEPQTPDYSKLALDYLKAHLLDRYALHFRASAFLLDHDPTYLAEWRKYGGTEVAPNLETYRNAFLHEIDVAAATLAAGINDNAVES